MSHQLSQPKFFPPPKFLEMSFVAVEIAQTGIYFLTTKKTRAGLIPDKFGMIPLVPGEFVHGEVVKKEPIIKALVNVRKKTGCDFVRFSMPEEKTYIFKTHLPKLKPEEIHDILDFKLEENIPLSSKEAVFDYDVLPAKNSGGLDLVVSVAPLKIVEDMGEIFKSAGLTPIFFSPESHNLAKSVVWTHNEQSIVVANIRDANIVLSLVVSGVVCQTSSINFGSSTLNDLLAKYYKVSPVEVNKIKKERLYKDDPENLEVFSHLINSISAVKDELYKFISYCNEREDIQGRVDKVLLCGQDAMISGLSRYLSSSLNLPVEIANVWTNNFDLNEYVPDIGKAESLNFAVVNGLNLL